MTDYRTLYEKDYIGSWDLKDGQDTIVRITKVIGGNLTGLGGRKTKKPVIYMHGTEKGFALNATNGKAIAGMYGPMIEEWVGKRIALYKSTTRNPNGDGDVDCIRVRPSIPAPKRAQQDTEEFQQPPQGGSDEETTRQTTNDKQLGVMPAGAPSLKDALAALKRKDFDGANDIARSLVDPKERAAIEEEVKIAKEAAT